MIITHVLKQIPKLSIEVEFDVSYSYDPGDHDTPPDESLEIEWTRTDGDLLTIFSWYTYNKLIDELEKVAIEYINENSGN